MKNVLVVEDNEALSGIMHDALTVEGYKVTLAHDGAEALQVAFDTHPDIILLDLTLPVMNGMDVLRSLRLDIWGKLVPIVIVTNKDTNESIMNAVREYAQAYFIKSTTPLKTITNTITELLAESGQPQ